MITRISARWLIGWDGTDHRTIENGELVFDEHRIVFVGRGWSGPVERAIDHGNAVIGPGFVDLDALADIDSTVLGFDNHPGWRKGRVWPCDYLASGPREALDGEALDLAKRWAFTSLLRNGITTAVPITSIIYRAWSETCDELMRAADVAVATGIRAYLGPAYCSGRSIVDDTGRHDMLSLPETRYCLISLTSSVPGRQRLRDEDAPPPDARDGGRSCPETSHRIGHGACEDLLDRQPRCRPTLTVAATAVVLPPTRAHGIVAILEPPQIAVEIARNGWSNLKLVFDGREHVGSNEMSESTFKAFAEKIQEDPELRQRLEAEADENGVSFDTVARIAAGEGYEFSVEDAGGELSEKQLDDVVGGAAFMKRTVLEPRFLEGKMFPKVEIYAGAGSQYMKWY